MLPQITLSKMARAYYGSAVLRILVGLLTLCALGFASAAELPGPRDELFAALSPAFEKARSSALECDAGSELQVDLLSERSVPGYEPGQIFGAKACGRLKYRYADLQRVFKSEGSILEALKRVKTFGPLKLLKESGSSNYVEFEILVPMSENYIVKSWVQFDVTDEMAVLHWYQEDSESRLENNRGFLVIVPEGDDRTKVYLRSYHILKKEYRLYFPKSSFAPGFTKSHYGNYVRAVKDYAQELIP